MARPATGYLRQRGDRWLASVPRLATAPKRLECSFPSETEAQGWIDAQLDRRAEGLEPEPPASRPAGPTTDDPPRRRTAPTRRAPAPPSLATLAYAWHHEYYEELEHANADRSADARRDLELHVLPSFATLLGTDLEVGRSMVKDWLRTMSGREPLTPGSSFVPGRIRYARDTVSGLLWLLRQVLAYARDQGYEVPRYAEGSGIRALHPLGREKKRRAPVVSMADTAAIAGQLHVVHQFVLWLLRLCGLRISESYGLVVANFFVDDQGDGFLVVGEAQGGRRFRARTASGEVVVSDRKENGKTDSAYRLIALPAPLTALVLVVIEIFHTAPNGTVDPTARLIPVIRSTRGGPAGFRVALRAAGAAVGGAEDEALYRVVPHDLRKSFATDLAWAESVSGLAARRAMGHRVGSDVFDLVYTLDSRLKEHLTPVARQVEAEIAEAGVTTLMVPTTRRPVYGMAIDPEHVAYVDGRLRAAGWQVRGTGELVSVREAAELLGLDLRATRRLFPHLIPATKRDGEWLAREDDVVTFGRRLDGCRFLTDVAAQAGVDYHTAYRTMHRLGITPDTDRHTRTLMLAGGDAEAILAELARIDRLHQRSVKVARAAAMLHTSESMVHQWARKGRLAYDQETDAGGAKFVTRSSIEQEKANRFGRQRPSVRVAELQALTGFSDEDVTALVAARLLVRVRPDGITPESVRTWAAGHRPALLASPLLRRVSA